MTLNILKSHAKFEDKHPTPPPSMHTYAQPA